MPCATRAGKFPCSSSDDIQRLPLRVSVTVVSVSLGPHTIKTTPLTR
jgi:hypothetical protein